MCHSSFTALVFRFFKDQTDRFKPVALSPVLLKNKRTDLHFIALFVKGYSPYGFSVGIHVCQSPCSKWRIDTTAAPPHIYFLSTISAQRTPSAAALIIPPA